MELRDSFYNHIDVQRQHCDVTAVDVNEEAFYEIGPCQSTKNIEIKFMFSNVTQGAFPLTVKYFSHAIGKLQILVLQAAKINSINNYISSTTCHCIRQNICLLRKMRKVNYMCIGK